MNKLHLIVVAVLDAAKAGGLKQDHAIALKAELLVIKNRLEALHEKLGEGCTARDFTLKALCALEGAARHAGVEMRATDDE